MIEDPIEQVKRIYQELQPEVIVFELRKRKITTRIPTVELYRWCKAIDMAGLPITVSIIRAVFNRSESAIRERLHRFGDLHILTLIRGIHGDEIRCIWKFNELPKEVSEHVG